MRRSISFLPRGTRVTILNLETFPLGTRAASKRFGNEYAHAASHASPCLVWKSTAKVREKGARSGQNTGI